MRILFHSTDKINYQNIIKKAEEDLFAKVDFFTDYEEAEYCIDIRYYDFIFIQYNEKNKKKYLNLFKSSLEYNKNSKIFLFGSNLKKELYQRYDYVNFIERDLEEKDILYIIKNYSSNIIEKDILKVNVKEKKVWITNEKKEKIEVSFKKKIDFYVFLYFMRHYKETINIQNILNATCEEPELTKDSIIESSISSIRKTFKEIVGINPIKAFKKVGYRFSF